MLHHLLKRRNLWVTALLLLFPSCGSRTRRTDGPMPQDAYVWQRRWNRSVTEAISAYQSSFHSLVFLAAEVSWNRGEPQVAVPRVDYETLRRAQRPVGIALRIGPYDGPFSSSNRVANFLSDLARGALRECTNQGVAVSEVQIDFDCASSKLLGYREWVHAIRGGIGPVPLVITSLPSWLPHKGFAELIRETDGFILQVHSLKRPQSSQAIFSLCDPEEALQAVERAARFGRPFRVALPTYGYTVGFDSTGKLIGLSADGPERAWSDATLLREIRADPKAIAELVRCWTRDRPKTLTGLIWYRLPVAGDSLNWSAPTLASVMRGIEPKEALCVNVNPIDDCLVEVTLRNDGDATSTRTPIVELSWPAGRLVAADGFGGYDIEPRQRTASLRPTTARPVRPGECRKIGWLRFETPPTLSTQLFAQ